MKTTATVFVALVLIARVAAAAPAATGYVDMDRVLQESGAGKTAVAALRKDNSEAERAVADAERRKDPGAAKLRAELPGQNEQRSLAAGGAVKRRAEKAAEKLRAARRLEQVKLRPADVLAIGGDLTDAVIAEMDAEDKTSAAAELATAHRKQAAAEAEAADLRRQLAAKSPPPPPAPHK